MLPTVKSHEHSRLGCQKAQDELLQKKEAQDVGFSIVGKFFSFPSLLSFRICLTVSNPQHVFQNQ